MYSTIGVSLLADRIWAILPVRRAFFNYIINIVFKESSANRSGSRRGREGVFIGITCQRVSYFFYVCLWDSGIVRSLYSPAIQHYSTQPGFIRGGVLIFIGPVPSYAHVKGADPR